MAVNYLVTSVFGGRTQKLEFCVRLDFTSALEYLLCCSEKDKVILLSCCKWYHSRN